MNYESKIIKKFILLNIIYFNTYIIIKKKIKNIDHPLNMDNSVECDFNTTLSKNRNSRAPVA